MNGKKAALGPRVSVDVRAMFDASKSTFRTLPEAPEAKVGPRVPPTENTPSGIVEDPEKTWLLKLPVKF
jgi:hypothetical protein